MSDDDQWSNEYQPFLWETNMQAAHEEEVRLANLAVKEALESFSQQKWYQTLGAKIRFSIYYVFFRLREKLAYSLSRLVPGDQQKKDDAALKLARKFGVW